MKKYHFLILSFFSLLLFSCADYKEVTFSGIENVNIVKMSQQGAEAVITAKIKNPNKTGFTIYKSDMDVTLNGMNAGKARLSDNVRVKANSEELYTFTIKSDFSTLSMADMPKLMAMAMSRNVNVGLKGNLKAGKFFYKKTIPVSITQRVPLSNN